MVNLYFEDFDSIHKPYQIVLFFIGDLATQLSCARTLVLKSQSPFRP